MPAKQNQTDTPAEQTFSYVVDSAERVVRIHDSGRVRRADIDGNLTAILATLDPSVGYDFLFDYSEVEVIQLTAEDIRHLATFFTSGQLGIGVRHLAFVARTDVVYGIARMLQGFCADPKVEIAVFRRIEQAELWLRPGYGFVTA